MKRPGEPNAQWYPPPLTRGPRGRTRNETVEGVGVNVLYSLLEGVREDLAQRPREVPLAELMARVADMPPALNTLPAFRSPAVSVIAEVKRKSPSKGAPAGIPDPASLAGEIHSSRWRGRITP